MCSNSLYGVKTSATVRTILYMVMPAPITLINSSCILTHLLHYCPSCFHYHSLSVCCSTQKQILSTVFTHSLLICDALYSMMPFTLVLGEYFYSYSVNVIRADFNTDMPFKVRTYVILLLSSGQKSGRPERLHKTHKHTQT